MPLEVGGIRQPPSLRLRRDKSARQGGKIVDFRLQIADFIKGQMNKRLLRFFTVFFLLIADSVFADFEADFLWWCIRRGHEFSDSFED